MLRWRTVWLLTVVGAFCLPGRPATGQEDWARRVDQAAACYARFDYDCVIESLEGFSVGRAAAESNRHTVELGVHLLAVTYIVRGVPMRARALLYDALTTWPDYRFEGEDLSPRFLLVFDEAHAILQGERAASGVGRRAPNVAGLVGIVEAGQRLAQSVAQWTRAMASTAPPPPSTRDRVDLRIEVGPSYELLSGNDADIFGNAFGLSVRLATEHPFGLSLEIGVDWYNHAVEIQDVVEGEDASSLTVLDFTGSVLYPWRWERVRLMLGGGAGYSAFGLDSAFDRGGLILQAVSKIQFFGTDWFGLGLEITPRLVFAKGVDGIEVSSPLLFGLVLFVDLDLSD